jgi:hypothetical protein
MVEIDSTTTDAAGGYRFDSLPAGEYAITAAATDWVPSGATQVTAKSGEVTSAADAALLRGVVVRFKLVDAESGAPLTFEKPTKGFVNRSRVAPDGQTSSIRESPITTFSEKGVAEVRLAPGTYKFYASIPDDDLARGADWMSIVERQPGASKPIEVSEAAAEITLSMRKLAPSPGRFAPAPPPVDAGNEGAKGSSLQPSTSLDFKTTLSPAEVERAAQSTSQVDPLQAVEEAFRPGDGWFLMRSAADDEDAGSTTLGTSVVGLDDGRTHKQDR